MQLKHQKKGFRYSVPPQTATSPLSEFASAATPALHLNIKTSGAPKLILVCNTSRPFLFEMKQTGASPFGANRESYNETWYYSAKSNCSVRELWSLTPRGE